MIESAVKPLEVLGSPEQRVNKEARVLDTKSVQRLRYRRLVFHRVRMVESVESECLQWREFINWQM